MSDIQLAGERTIKRFRVAREGQTVDGRELSRDEIIQMAESYDPTEYTARINVEHISSWGLASDSFPALGDVVAADYEIQTFIINGRTVELACLYATLSALPVLLEINAQGKKLFTSIEFYKKFADTDKAYLVGLAVTDTPASRGTEPLKFTQKNTFLAEPVELVAMNTQNPIPALEPVAQAIDTAQNSFLEKLKAIFNKKTLSESDQAVIIESFTKVNEHLQNTSQDLASAKRELTAQITALNKQVAEQAATLSALQIALSATPNANTVTEAVGAGHELTQY